MTSAEHAAVVVNSWATALNAGDADAIASLFAKNAFFWATVPDPLVGRNAIREYYQNIPKGLRVEASMIAHTGTDDHFVAAVTVVFTLPDGAKRAGRLSMAIHVQENGAEIIHYHMAMS